MEFESFKERFAIFKITESEIENFSIQKENLEAVTNTYTAEKLSIENKTWFPPGEYLKFNQPKPTKPKEYEDE